MPTILYGEMKYAKQRGGRGQYGHVCLRVLLDGPEQAVVFRNNITNGAVPAQFVSSIEAGIMTSVKGGILQQYGHEFARIELVDGSYHDVDSSHLAFYVASVMALDNALRKLPPRPSSGDDDDPGVRVRRPPRGPRLYDAAAVPEPNDS
jgi:elongation factor G